MKKLKIPIVVLLSVMLVFAVAACRTDPESEEHDGDTNTSEISDDYDIAANLRVTRESDEDKVIETDYFILKLPLGDTWDYDCDSKTSVTIYNIASREAGCGGRLVSILAFDEGSKDYETLPDHAVIGEKDGKVYVVAYPSDVQFDFENEQTMQDYQTVYEMVNKIRDGAGASPVVLK